MKTQIKLKSIIESIKSLHHLHKDYRLYEGENDIVAIFEDNSRLTFEVHYHATHGEDREKWRRKAFSKWKTIATKLHNDVQLTEVGNPITKGWKESFQSALEDPELQEYIRKPEHHRVYPDKGYPASIQGKAAPCMDSVNFTPRA